MSATVIFETYTADRVDLIASATSLMKLYLRVPYSDSMYLMEFVLVYVAQAQISTRVPILTREMAYGRPEGSYGYVA